MSFSDKQIVEILTGKLKPFNQAIQELYSAHYPDVKDFILKEGGSEAKAAEIFQASLVKLFLTVKKGKFDPSISIGQYIFQYSEEAWQQHLDNSSNSNLSKLTTNSSSELFIQASNEQIKVYLKQIGGECESFLVDFYFKKLPVSEICKKYNLENEEASHNLRREYIQKLIRLIQNNKNKI